MAIECKFRFEEDDSSSDFISEQNVKVPNQQPNLEQFECEDTDIESETDMNVQSRFNFEHFQPDDDDDYESVVVCETRNKTIYPKGFIKKFSVDV